MNHNYNDNYLRRAVHYWASNLSWSMATLMNWGVAILQPRDDPKTLR